MSQGLGTQPLLLTPSGSHHTYSQKVGGMHPTGMVSCLFIIVIIIKRSKRVDDHVGNTFFGSW